MDMEDIQREANARNWFHRIELVPGVWSPGTLTVNAESALTQHGFSSDLRGKRVIDIGAADGAYSREFARRGASVLAVDMQDPDKTGFSLANSLSWYPVEYRTMSVYELSPDTVGTFDIAWYWGVFYHLREPLLGFRNINRILNDEGHLNFEGAILDYATPIADPRLEGRGQYIEALSDLPLAYFTSGNFAQDWSNWYIPNVTCLREWLKASGFKDIEICVNREATRGFGTAVKDGTFADREYHRL
jgi:tRNA (mo5U34)-methyltransferase